MTRFWDIGNMELSIVGRTQSTWKEHQKDAGVEIVQKKHESSSKTTCKKILPDYELCIQFRDKTISD